MAGGAGEYVGEPSLRVDMVELGRCDRGVRRHGVLAPRVKLKPARRPTAAGLESPHAPWQMRGKRGPTGFPRVNGCTSLLATGVAAIPPSAALAVASSRCNSS